MFLICFKGDSLLIIGISNLEIFEIIVFGDNVEVLISIRNK